MSQEFSLERYREILEIGLSQGYQFIGYDKLADFASDKKTVILRHDIDYLPEWAMNFAEIENKVGIRSAYFFQVCAKTYNLRESNVVSVVRELKRTGHEVGLHFDATWAGDPAWDELPQLCADDKELFERITGVKPCEIISFHNPYRYIDQILNKPIEGIHHTYEQVFFSDIKYLSDSQGWYEGCPSEILRAQKYPKLQLLMHPYIWPRDGTGDFIRDVAHIIRYRSEELTDYLLAFHPVCKKNESRLRSELEKQESSQ